MRNMQRYRNVRYVHLLARLSIDIVSFAKCRNLFRYLISRAQGNQVERIDRVAASDRRGEPTGLFDVSFETSFHFLPIDADAIIAIDSRMDVGSRSRLSGICGISISFFFFFFNIFDDVTFSL